MSIVFDDVHVDIFIYKSLISKVIDSGWEPKKTPNILLSKIKSISSDVISEFENMGIYDLEDLNLANQSILQKQESILDANFYKIRNEVIQASFKFYHIPLITLKLPSNYAIISLIQHSNNLDLAMSWRGLLFSWKNIPILKIIGFIKEFKILLAYCNHPELITDIRTWSFTLFEGFKPSDLSVYMSNYDVLKSIDEYCLSLNQPNYKKNIKNDELLFQIYSIEFILWYANKNRTNADLICN